jgi:hypothetical protein
MKFLKQKQQYFVYGLVALAVMLPLLLPGYILTLDMVFVPNPPLPQTLNNEFLFDAALHYGSNIVSGDVMQKGILLSILVFAGVGMHKLMQYVQPKALAPQWQWAAYVAGIFYVINPFVYGRFMAGQYKVLLAYMVLPFFVRALLQFLANPGLKSLWPVVLCALLVSIFSIHVLGFVFILSLVLLVATLWRWPAKDYLWRLSKNSLLGLVAFSTLSCYWLVPTILGQGTIASTIASFNNADASAFMSDGGILAILQLQGFWVEAQGFFRLPGDLLPLSGLWQLFLWILIGVGFIAAYKQQRAVASAFMAVAIMSIMLALGSKINTWLAAVLPFFAGYREPHKFVAIVAFCFAYFSAFGIATFLQIVAKRFRDGLLFTLSLALVLLLPFLITPTMLWGFNGQLMPRQYPADWHAMRDVLQSLNHNQKVLFLPWHLYMRFDFAGRIIANPGEKFFGPQLIVSDDPEFDGASSGSTNPIKQTLSGDILPDAAASGTTLGKKLQPLGIGYILLAKEADFETYNFWSKQTDLHLMYETDNFRLYKITSEGQ